MVLQATSQSAQQVWLTMLEQLSQRLLGQSGKLLCQALNQVRLLAHVILGYIC